MYSVHVGIQSLPSTKYQGTPYIIRNTEYTTPVSCGSDRLSGLVSITKWLQFVVLLLNSLNSYLNMV